MAQTKYHKLIETKCLYDHFFRINEFLILKEEDQSEFKRFVVERPDATAILLFNRDDNTILFVRQLRVPAFGREDDPYLLELPAGVLELGEEPEQTIVREALEETGFNISNPEFISSFYASPGTFAEKIHIFFKEVTQSDQTHDGGGLDEETEDIQIKAILKEKVFSMMDNGQIMDAKSLVALFWFRFWEK